ncbi:transferase [Sphingobacterium sp. lm-10]|uniref:putative sugar nucleotidyl transferase n=1 Tax=Sphingobacterium sp. lm-10 TaxID=2944904 RepID=UPI002020FDB2|nr:putative sugar nucleotidyl transferase [Sphingobacterium sp. lm-10]MCL7987584.1 transferase [Sphingobacterium sp. lm-10]
MIDAIFLFDDAAWRKQLLPLVATRPVSDLRVGIYTIAQKWSLLTNGRSISYLTVDYLREKYTKASQYPDSAYVIKGNVIPDRELVERVNNLPIGSVLMKDGEWIACHALNLSNFTEAIVSAFTVVGFDGSIVSIEHPEDIYLTNAGEINSDLVHGQHAANAVSLPEGNTLYGNQLFLEGTPSFRGVSIHTEEGPVYIGAGVVIEDGVYIKGPVAICAGARVKTGARLYPNVTIGPGATVCGEINNTVIWGNSAKGHEGYLGCAVIGEGCNLGAGTSNSNLRNDWKNVRLYDYSSENYRDTGLLKCGLIMGDFAMAAIHTRFTTGTVIGVGAQLALSRFIPKFVPDFLWLTDERSEAYQLDKFIAMLVRRDAKKINTMNLVDSRIFECQHALTENLRKKYLYSLSK